MKTKPEHNREMSVPNLGRLHHLADRALINRLTRNFRTEGCDISFEQYLVLNILWSEDGLNQQQLANTIGTGKANITRLVDGLEKRNLVIRITDRRDRRVRWIHLTHAGKSLRDKLVQIARKARKEAYAGISKTDLETYEKVLDYIISNYEKDYH